MPKLALPRAASGAQRGRERAMEIEKQKLGFVLECCPLKKKHSELSCALFREPQLAEITAWVINS